MNLGLRGAPVCISGGSKGIGRAFAELFAQEGARVVVSGRHQDSIDEAVDALARSGSPDAFGVQADNNSAEDIARLFRSIEERWGQLNTLVNVSAGAFGDHTSRPSFVEVTDAEWDATFTAILKNTVRSTRAAVPLMRKAGWGRVVNISTIFSRIGPAEAAAYMTAKAGLDALGKNMAWSLAKENILVNTVTLGSIYSASMKEYFRKRGRDVDNLSLAEVSRLAAEVWGAGAMGVIGRIATPEELAPQVVLLGSPANTYMVGANIAMDGGTHWSIG